MSMIANLHNETVTLVPREDGGPGFNLRVVVHAHHTAEEGPHVVSDMTMSPDETGRLLIKWSELAGFACSLTPLDPDAARQEKVRRALTLASVEGSLPRTERRIVP